tara:strand:+ start:14089 stop:16830 length:2742 start_codon:yes stop_codon:yes gene_type:complete
MNKFPLFLISLGLIFSCQSEREVSFNNDIKPIINKKCISCHGGVKKTAGFSLLFHEEALANTDEGSPAIIPGNSKESRLIQRLHETDLELRMPFEKPALNKEEIGLFTRWIDQGAKWGTHWAYIPPKNEKIPDFEKDIFDVNFFDNSIDNFIAARMSEKKLSPNPESSKSVLARKVSFDISGLPPDKRLFKLFLENKISYENYIDSLLINDSYGEKWASWWLDLARYSDTKGYEADRGRNIWEYRDWVIKSFNNDLPFDKFTIEQLAGDLLPDPSYDQLLATAFHRNTMNNDEGGTNDEEYRVAAVIDRVNTTFDVWQSTTMSCVQCHDHPYDPIRQKEYYQLMSFFNNTSDEDLVGDSPNLRSYDDVINKKIDKVLKIISEKADKKTFKIYNNFFKFLEPKYASHNSKVLDSDNGFISGETLNLRNKGLALFKNINTRGFENLYFKHIGGRLNTRLIFRKNSNKGKIIGSIDLNQEKFWANGKKNRYFKIKISKELKPFDLYIEAKNNDLITNNLVSYDYKDIAAQIDWITFLPIIPNSTNNEQISSEIIINEILNSPKNLTPIMVENEDFMKRKTYLFDRGSWLNKKEEVKPEVPSVFNKWDIEWKRNRLGLSNWIISQDNPLTARTIVNRVWYQLFGKGLVSTLEDLGTQSETPTHPALLDWLSFNFMNDMKWSVKTLVKKILLSSTYKQSSNIKEENLRLDPDNLYYSWGPKLRLTAESVRDQALFVSELLSEKKYGPGVMPPQPEGIWEHPYLGNLWKESKGEDKHRRAIYTYLKRTSPYPSFISFDASSREICLVRRLPSNTPLQALVTMNDPVYLEAAINLAKVNQVESVESSIKKMYESAIYKEINELTLEELAKLYKKAFDDFKKDELMLENFFGLGEKPDIKLASLSIVANAIMNLDEFLTHG